MAERGRSLRRAPRSAPHDEAAKVRLVKLAPNRENRIEAFFGNFRLWIHENLQRRLFDK